MAKLIFTEEDERLIEERMQGLDPAEWVSNLALRDRVPAATWDALMDYQRNVIRETFKTGLVVDAIRDALPMFNEDQASSLHGTLFEVIGGTDETLGYPDGWSDGVPFKVVHEYEEAFDRLHDEVSTRANS